VIEPNDTRLIKEQELLKKLYECQDSMEMLLDEGKEDKHYFLMEILIKRLELYLQNSHDIL
jgi:hypothetical protein